MNMGNTGGDSVFTLISMFGAVFLIMYFLMIRPRRKKEKEIEQLRSQLKIGDIVTTIGGIIGIVVTIKDDGVTLETGTDRNKIRVKKWAIQTVEQVLENNSNSAPLGESKPNRSDKEKKVLKVKEGSKLGIGDDKVEVKANEN